MGGGFEACCRQRIGSCISSQFSDEALIEWINTCNRQGGVCTLDWPFDPRTGLVKNFGMAQLKRIASAVKGLEPH
jgi:hypothetical protein